MTDSSVALKDGTEYIPATQESTESQTLTQEPVMHELLLDMEPLKRIANGEKVSVPRSPHFTRKDVVTAFQQAFDLIGGVPALAIWGNSNRTEFYKLYSRLLPSQASSALGESNVIRLEMAVPPGPLDQ
jgi:hypothetical protein